MLLDGLDIKIPRGNLIPTAGLRRCIVDILCKEISPKKILEIGTGSTAIIAQLFALREKKVYATEIDKKSLEYAKENIYSNSSKFKYPIRLLLSDGGLLEWLYESYEDFFPIDLVISLPPYYEEGSTSKFNSRGFLGTENELFSSGTGEEFSVKLIKEASNLKENISNIAILWKDESSFNKGFENFKTNKCENIFYKILAGSRTRYLSITTLKV